MAAMRSNYIVLGSPQVLRAKELNALGFGSMDALHVACAEIDNCDVFLTTDDHLMARYRTHQRHIMIRIANPLAWIAEVQVQHDDKRN